MRLPKQFVFALLVLGVVGLLWHHAISTSCMSDASSIPAMGGGASAEIVETSCDVLGGSNVVEISIVSSESGARSQRVTVFKYELSGDSGPVNVAWTGDKELTISVDRVFGFETRETRAAGYTIRYHIGAVGPSVLRAPPHVQQ